MQSFISFWLEDLPVYDFIFTRKTSPCLLWSRSYALHSMNSFKCSNARAIIRFDSEQECFISRMKKKREMEGAILIHAWIHDSEVFFIWIWCSSQCLSSIRYVSLCETGENSKWILFWDFSQPP